MLPWMIYDNNKYGKWMVKYWLESSSLPEEGLFSQSITGKPSSCLPLDLWTDLTITKESQLKAGCLKVLKNEKLLLTGCRNANSDNRLRSTLHTTANSTTSNQQHSENTRTHITHDEQAVHDTERCISEYGCYPIFTDSTKLRSLQSGVLASIALAEDFETAQRTEEELFKTFCLDWMLSNNTLFGSTIRRTGRHNFSNSPPVEGDHTVKVTKTEVIHLLILLLKSMMRICSEWRYDVSCYRLTFASFQYQWNNEKDVEVKTCGQIMHGNHQSSPSSIQCCAWYGINLVSINTPSSEDCERSDETSFTWRNFASKMFPIIMSRHKHASQVVLNSDFIVLPFTIKDNERYQLSRDSVESISIFIIDSDKLQSTTGFQDFLCKPSNKEMLQNFLLNVFPMLCRKYYNVKFCYSVGPVCWTLQ